MKVRATRMGYIGHKRRKPGEVFELPAGMKVSKNWMEVVEKDASPEPKTSPAKSPRATDQTVI